MYTWREAGQALRGLWRSPGLVVCAVLLLGVGIGAGTVTFSVVNAFWLRPLGVQQPEKLVRLVKIRPRIGARSSFPVALMEAMQKQPEMFRKVGAGHEFMTLYEDGVRRERVLVGAVSRSYFEVMGVGGDGVWLTSRFRDRCFGIGAGVVGKAVTLRGLRFVVSGVLPEGFHGTGLEAGPDLFVTTGVEQLQRGDDLEIVARLVDGVPMKVAEERAYALYAASGEDVVGRNEFAVESLEHGVSRLRAQAEMATRLAMGGAGVLALMVCLNLSGLLLARVLGRAREMVVRRALGATAGRIVLGVLVESGAMVLAGGVVGLGLALVGMGWVNRVLPPVRLLDNSTVENAMRLELDWRVFGFVVLLSVVAVVLVALAPMLEAAKANPGSRGQRGRGWKLLVGAQVGVCTALLFGAVAVGGSVRNLWNEQSGMARKQIVSFTLRDESEKALVGVMKRWSEAVRGLDGVEAVGYSTIRMLRGSGQKTTMGRAGEMVPKGEFLNTSTMAVGPGYFEAMGQRRLEGQVMRERMVNGLEQVVVNETFAKRFGNGGSVVGKRFGFGAGKVVPAEVEVVGVVSDAKYRSMREPMQPVVYGLVREEAGKLTLVVRAKDAPKGMVGAVLAELKRVGGNWMAEDVTTLEEDIEASIWTERALGWVSWLFAGVAGLVASMGLAGLMAFLVRARRTEIAVRVAVGAERRDLWWLVMGDVVRPVGCGLVGGMVVGVGLLEMASGVLYGMSSRDGWVGLVVALVVGGIGVGASVLPAREAMGIEPAEALRGE
jgi:predicted permease